MIIKNPDDQNWDKIFQILKCRWKTTGNNKVSTFCKYLPHVRTSGLYRQKISKGAPQNVHQSPGNSDFLQYSFETKENLSILKELKSSCKSNNHFVGRKLSEERKGEGSRSSLLTCPQNCNDARSKKNVANLLLQKPQNVLVSESKLKESFPLP